MRRIGLLVIACSLAGCGATSYTTGTDGSGASVWRQLSAGTLTGKSAGEIHMAAGMGMVWLAWPDTTHEGKGVLWRHDGVSWSLCGGKPFSPGAVSSIAILPDGTNAGWVYADGENAGRGVTMHCSGTNIETPPGGQVSGGRMSTASADWHGGFPLSFFQDSAVAGGAVVLKRFQDFSSWNIQPGGSSGVALFPTMAVQGARYGLAWADSSVEYRLAAAYFDGSSLQNAGMGITGGPVEGLASVMTASFWCVAGQAKAQNVLAVWRHDFGNGGWNEMGGTVSAGIHDSISLTSDASGRPWIAARTRSGGDALVVRRWDGTNWQSPPLAGLTVGSILGARLAKDATGRILLGVVAKDGSLAVYRLEEADALSASSGSSSAGSQSSIVSTGSMSSAEGSGSSSSASSAGSLSSSAGSSDSSVTTSSGGSAASAVSSAGGSSAAASSSGGSSVSASSAPTMVTLTVTPTPGYWTTSAAPFVTLVADPPDAQIWYTTDGSMPLVGTSPVYSAGFALDRTAVIRAIGTKAGLTQSPLLEAHYTVAAIKTLATGQDVSSGTGSDGELRHGFWMASGRFTMVTANVVQDALTGLQWTKKAIGSAVPWTTALSSADSDATDGNTDWRLPNVRELENLLNYGVTDPAMWLKGEGFDAALPSGYYWTSTSLQSDGANQAWAVNFGTDDQRIIPLMKSMPCNLLLVRLASAHIPKTGQTTSYGTGSDGNLMYGAADPSPRFIYENNRLADRRSGLVWYDARSAQTGWAAALAAAEGLNYGADTDWHCPNVRQLFSLVNFGATDTISWIATVGSIAWVNDQLAWSSTAVMHGAGKCWQVNLVDGRVTATLQTAGPWTLMPIRGGMLIP